MNKEYSKVKTLSLGRGMTFYTLAVITAFALLMYLFFIGQTVFKLVAEKNITAQTRALAAEISQLELETLSLNDTISIEHAYELGFVDATSTQYVAKTGELSLR